MGLFGIIKRGLEKTKQILNTDIRDLFKKEGRLVDDTFLEELFASLIRTDMGVEAAKEIREETRKEFRGRVVFMEDLTASVKVKLKEIMRQDSAPVKLRDGETTVIMVCGVNGSGKTTSIAKLTKMFRDQGKSVVLGAADTFRAAAVEQLTVWAGRLGAEIVTGKPGCDPASVAFSAVETAIAKKADVCIVDTAGRLQTQVNLMRELEKIHRVIGKVCPSAPHEILLVLDATTGQNGISQAKHFTECVHCNGLILAKLDGTAKGGCAVAIRKQVDLPVKYVGVGEKAEDLALFDPDAYVDAMFAD
ncbi:MAG: signal recognition particle-docking protein FtsY [Thermoguttaceae bacterium]|nr:signal recognition particle-docking protein FtsY [Planctomycetaceae bacterium]MBQ4142883.1 signal recognition particle-docking protein FtsY [Thermoguttaceae bacterium]